MLEATGIRLSELAGIRYDHGDPRRGGQCGVDVFPHRFRHHFSHTWLDRGGAEGDLMELNGWSSAQMPAPGGKPRPAERPHKIPNRLLG